MDFAAAADRATALWDTYPCVRYAFGDLGAFAQTFLASGSDLDAARAAERDLIAKRCVAGAERLAITRNPAFAAPQSKLWDREGSRLTLWIYGPVERGGVDADEVVDALKRNSDAAVALLRISSHGGKAAAAEAIELALTRFRGRTIALVDHFAMSAAAQIACSCDRVVMRSNAVLMLHPSRVTIRGDANFFSTAAMELRNSDTFAGRRILAKRACRDHEAFREAIARERYLSAAEALDLGLCDAITRPLDGAAAIINQETSHAG